ncbi:hypothetical protein HPB52_004299 [Rhipicephalus sanguineus]|uniref:Uncharacterized protein n=1 Tax=Rhipicephalus sanguineus TaxID=34632 RepID=A0A9D4T8J9_RHISA|nr:hypothetical protein HPB52_004299 [Rhipicephalus sanguineus]
MIFDTMTGYQVEVFLVDYGETLMVDRKAVEGSSWDTASIDYVKSTVRKADVVHVEVLGETISGGLYGKIFINCNKNVMSLDEELIKLKYAFPDTEAGREGGQISKAFLNYHQTWTLVHSSRALFTSAPIMIRADCHHNLHSPKFGLSATALDHLGR